MGWPGTFWRPIMTLIGVAIVTTPIQMLSEPSDSSGEEVSASGSKREIVVDLLSWLRAHKILYRESYEYSAQAEFFVETSLDNRRVSIYRTRGQDRVQFTVKMSLGKDDLEIVMRMSENSYETMAGEMMIEMNRYSFDEWV